MREYPCTTLFIVDIIFVDIIIAIIITIQSYQSCCSGISIFVFFYVRRMFPSGLTFFFVFVTTGGV